MDSERFRGPTSLLNFKTLSLKLGRGEMIIEIKNSHFLKKNVHISNRFTDQSTKDSYILSKAFC